MDDSLTVPNASSEVDYPDEDVSRFKGWYKEFRSQMKDWMDAAEEDYAFYSGDQWSQEDKAILEDGNRPVITFNRVGPIVDSVVGMEVSNRQRVQYIPRDLSDNWISQNFTAVVDWVRDETDAEDAESESFQDMAICGIGVTEHSMDYDDDPDGLIRMERVDPMEIGWDPSAKKKNLADRRYDFRVKDIPIETARELFPDYEDEDLNASWASMPESGRAHDAQEAPFYKNDQSTDTERSTVRILHFQWFEKETVYRVVDQGKSVFFEPSKYRKLRDRMETFGIELRGVKQERKKYKYAFVGRVVLDEGDLDTEFTRKFMTGKRDRNENTWYGIVRSMKDPQRWANKWLSQTLHIINSNAKGGLLAEKTAFDNPRQAEETWAQPDAITWLKQGGLDKVKEKAPLSWPSGMDKLMEFAVSSIRDVSGMNLELLGMANRQQAGVVEAQRKQSGITILAALFDALRKYRKDAGRLMADFIQLYLTEGRMIRIMGENGDPQYVPFMKSDEAIRYDLIVDEAPNSPNQKEKTWEALVQMMPFLQSQPMAPEVYQEIIRNSPMPVAMSQKIVNAMQNFQPPPDPKMQLEQAKMQAEQQKGQAQLQMKQQEVQMKSEADMRKSVMDMQLKETDLQHEMKLDEIRLKHEMMMEEMKARFQLQLERQKAGIQADLEQKKASVQMGIQKQKADLEGGSAMVEKMFSKLPDDLVSKIGESLNMDADRVMQEAEQRIIEFDERISGIIEESVSGIVSDLGDVKTAVQQLAEEASAPVEIIPGKNGRPAVIRKGGRERKVNYRNGRLAGVT